MNCNIFKHLRQESFLKHESYPFALRAKFVGEFFFGQGNLAGAHPFYGPQADYLNISSSEILMISDENMGQEHIVLEKGGVMVSVGHYNREQNFVMYFPTLASNQIQLSRLEE